VHHEPFKNVAEGIQSIVTSVALVGGGLWAFWRFVINANKVDLDIGVNFVRKQGNNWMIECVALVKNPGNVRLDFKEFTYELHYALSSDDFSKQTTEEGTAKESNLDFRSLHFLYKRSWLKDGEDDNDGKVEEETKKAISPPAWSALQLVADGLADEDEDYWYLEPGERTRYAVPASLPAETTIVLLQCDFYDKNWHVESVRKIYGVPATLTISQKSKPSS
jgi:hypothetical protein